MYYIWKIYVLFDMTLIFTDSKTTFIKLINWCRTGKAMHNHIKAYALYFSWSST